jgi:lysyl endopeptidase
MRRPCFHIIIFLLGSFPGLLSAQLSKGGVPLVVSSQKSQMQWRQIEPVRSDQLILEDEWAAMTGKKSQRIAKEMPCNLNPANSGEWHTHTSGTRIWQLGIKGEGALALGLVFNRYFLESGVRLYVYDPAREFILGAYTQINNKASGMLPISYLNGDRLIIQLEIPAGINDYGDLQLGAVRHAYRPVIENKSTLGFGASGDCNVDINCTLGEDWQLLKRSVVMLINGENCTGVLINNTKQDSTPYILTAAHCVFASNIDKSPSTTFYFNYESPGCDSTEGINYHTISGATLVSTGDTLERTVDIDSLDFALLKLSVAPPDSFLPYFAGWSHSSSTPSSTATIHHPAADVMKISTDNDPTGSGPLSPELSYSKDLVRGSFWRVLEWDAGTTEGGSSGCPLFDQNHHLVGTLTGGQASCDNSINDDFTRFDYAWDYYPDSLRQLKHWLDPENTGVVSIGGMGPIMGSEDKALMERKMLLYPNPARDHLNIELKDNIIGDINVSIFNTAGILQYQCNPPTRGQIIIPVDQLPTGLYLLQIRTTEYLATDRFLIHR